MSLYHKYRPEYLGEMRGNEEVVSALDNLLSKPESMPHCYLFQGNTGCGKTTFARIIKNTLQISDNDYTELNTSDMRGIDTIRDLIKNSAFKPLNSSHRIYLVDECHKLTNDAQNAFLKILEDTPKHIIFILCTTEPDKLIKAIRGRCQEFQVKPLQDREMKRLLKSVIRKEGVELEDEIIDKIVEVSEGHPRNALQVLEKIINTDAEKRLNAVQKAFTETTETIELCRALFGNKGWKEVSGILNKLTEVEVETIRRQVLGYGKSILLKGDHPKAGLIMEMFVEPFYNSGFPGLVFACYTCVKG